MFEFLRDIDPDTKAIVGTFLILGILGFILILFQIEAPSTIVEETKAKQYTECLNIVFIGGGNIDDANSMCSDLKRN